MPGTWKSSYLLNLVLVAKADGEVRPIEVLFLSRCRSRVEGDHRTLADAVMRSYWEDETRTGSLISDEATLRDMIIMAMADGERTAGEQAVVYRFIDAARITPPRVDAILREASDRLNDELRAVGEVNELRIGRLSLGRDSPPTA